jgi:hypothetical protein
MPGKKAKVTSKAVPSKTALSKTVKKSASAKSTNVKKSAAPVAKVAKVVKGGALGSIKKMLGLGSTQGTEGKRGPKNVKQEQVSSEKASMKTKPASKPAPEKTAKPAVLKKDIPSAVAVATKSAKAEAKAEKKAAKAAHSSHGVCREVACELMSTTGGYCRMHYIKNWKKIKRKEMILKEKKLNSYIEELVSKYPDKYIEAIRQDLASEKDFAKVISDLEIEEGLDDFESVETESAEGIIDNLKRDFEDDGDVF